MPRRRRRPRRHPSASAALEVMALIEIGAAVFARQVVVVRRERIDAAGVVVRGGECVWTVPCSRRRRPRASTCSECAVWRPVDFDLANLRLTPGPAARHRTAAPAR